MKITVTVTYKNGKTTISRFSHLPSAQSFAWQMRAKGCKVKINN
jgi:hypothetical protein